MNFLDAKSSIDDLILTKKKIIRDAANITAGYMIKKNNDKKLTGQHDEIQKLLSDFTAEEQVEILTQVAYLFITKKY